MLAIRAAGLFDGEAFARGGATVFVEAGTVVEVGNGHPDVAEDVHVLDFGDATLMPGLVDTHVHLVGDSEVGALDRVAGYSGEELATTIAASLQRQLAAGVTTVRDLGDRDWVAVEHRDRQRAQSGGPVSAEPFIVASGPPVTSRRGHCFYMGGEVEGLAGIGAAVQERADRGVDIVKVMASGGMNTAGTDVLGTQFSEEELALLVRRSHDLGLPVTAHAHSLSSVEQALSAGVDQLEHCSCLTETGVAVSDALIETLASRSVFVGAALGAPPAQALAQAPPALRELMERSGATASSFRDLRLQTVERMHRAGVRFVAGRDSGIAPFLAHGSMWESAVFLREAGATVAEALAAATSLAADACGVGARKGRLRSGYDADIAVVDGDPRTDLAAVGRVRAVFLGGRQVP